MSSKSDRDNRSNQLNPNNAAYYSSRASHDDECDEGEVLCPRDPLSAIREHFALERMREEDLKNARPVVECFLLDALTFTGDSLSGEFRVMLPNALFAGLRISNCADVAIYYGRELLSRAFPDLRLEIACLRIRRLDGSDVFGGNYSYVPKEPDSFYDAPDRFEMMQRLNALWSDGVRDLCEMFNQRLDQGAVVSGQYLGTLLVDKKRQLVYLPSTISPDQIPVDFSFRPWPFDEVLSKV